MPLELQGQQDQMETQVLRVVPDLLALWEIQVLKEPWVVLDLMEHQEGQACRAPQGQRGQQVTQDRLVRQVL